MSALRAALVTGLQSNTLNRTLGAQAHVVVAPPEEVVAPVWPRDGDTQVLSETQARAQRLRTVANWPALQRALTQRPGIEAVSPMAAGPALARRGEATRAVAITGVELALYDRIVNLRDKLVDGALRLGPGEAIVGQTLARDLGVRVGDRLTVSTGTRSDTVRISGLVDLGVKDLNRRVVIMPLRAAQSLLDLAGGAYNSTGGAWTLSRSQSRSRCARSLAAPPSPDTVAIWVARSGGKSGAKGRA